MAAPSNDNFEFIRAHSRHEIFVATHAASGVRSRFKVVEPMDPHKGWLMRDIENRIPMAVLDSELINLAVA